MLLFSFPRLPGPLQPKRRHPQPNRRQPCLRRRRLLPGGAAARQLRPDTHRPRPQSPRPRATTPPGLPPPHSLHTTPIPQTSILLRDILLQTLQHRTGTTSHSISISQRRLVVPLSTTSLVLRELCRNGDMHFQNVTRQTTVYRLQKMVRIVPEVFGRESPTGRVGKSLR